MDFRGRLSQPSSRQTSTPGGHPVEHTDTFTGSHVAGSPDGPSKLFKVGGLVLLLSIAILIIAITFLAAFARNAQQRAVNSEQYQAVFLDNGQVYFGKIARINKDVVDLRGIYYLQTNSGEATTQSTDASNVSLVKLGCELHSPSDRMLINGAQVIFWENIQDNGQVVKAIEAYKKQNKGKINCSQQSQNSTQQAPSSSSTGTGSTADTSSSTGTTGTSGTTGTTGTSTGTGSTTTTPKKP